MSPHLGGFAWHVKDAFCDPLSKCLLEEGDTIHSEASMYESWPPPAGSMTLQITKPKRGTNLSLSNEFRNVFENGWLSECELELLLWQEGGEALKTPYITTQGRLYSCLWHGNTAFLDQNLTPQPDMPKLLADARQLLKVLGDKSLRTRREYIPNQLRGARTTFAVCTDKTSETTKQKIVDLKAALGFNRDYTISHIQANQFFLSDDFCPTAYVTLFAFQEDSHEEIFKLVKAALYKRDLNAKKPKFSLSAHGIFLTMDFKEDCRP